MSALPSILGPGRRALLARLIANGLMQALTMWLTACITQAAVESMTATSGAGNTRWLVLAAGLLGSAVVLLGLRAAERRDAERMGQRYAAELRLVLFDHLARVSPRDLQRRRQGSLMLRFVGDLKAMRQWVSLGLARVIVAGLGIAGVLIGLLLVEPRLALASSVALMLCAMAARIVATQTKAAMQEARYRQSMLAANVTEKVSSMAVLQLFGQIRRERQRIARQGTRLEVAAATQAQYAALLRSLGDAAAMVASGAVLLTGGWLAAIGVLTPGAVIAAMVLAGLQAPALRDLGLAIGYRASADVSRDKFRQFLVRHPQIDDIPGAPVIVAPRGRLEFRDVRLGDLFEQLSAVAEPGRITLIRGPNGAGKSTLLALAARLIQPDAGHILLDDQPLSAHRLESVRRCIGMVGPDLPLLRGTLDANLRYRWPNAPEPELRRIRDLCRIDELAATLPDGLQSRIDEGGRNLSPGQRQRVMLARALLGSPPLLLLDEADANLDPDSEAMFDHILADYPGSVLMVSHRQRHLAATHVVWTINNKRLVTEPAPTPEEDHDNYRLLPRVA